MRDLIIVCAVVTIVLSTTSLAQTDAPVIVRHVDNQGEISFDGFHLSSPERAVSVNSTTIALSAGSGISGNASALAAFERAAQNWQNYLGDNVALNINIDLVSLGAGILGSTGSTSYYAGFNTIRNAMATGGDTGSAAEAATLSYLPTGAQYSAYVPSGFSLSGNMEATRANLLALGFSQNDLGGYGTPDASITFSSDFSWDYDNSNGVTSGMFCFESVATHEIGHVLGFVSEVDWADYALDLEATASLYPRPLDLFRFSAGNLPTNTTEFTNNTRDLAPGGTDYFSYLDDDILMSTGRYNGDGRQASHWKDNLGLGILDPTFASGEIGLIAYNDLVAMDLIGWQIVPEPATLCLFALGGLLLGRRKSA